MDPAHPHVHDHDHDHDHDHTPASFGAAFAIGIGLNSAYVVAEAIYGVLANSVALVADAGHNLSDVLGLAAAWLAAHLARRPPNARYTYGLRGSSILAALGNAALLLVVTGGIAWAAILRLFHPTAPGGTTIIVVALVGVAVNGLTALLFASGRKGDLNIRGAFLHMASDALVALGVALSGAIYLVTRWAWIDPAASLLISVIIIAGTWRLLRESLNLAVQAVPAGIDRTGVLAYLNELPGVSEVHDLHIWGMSTTETALTAHLVRPLGQVSDELLHDACHDLRARFHIHHATLQMETGALAHPCELAADEVV